VTKMMRRRLVAVVVVMTVAGALPLRGKGGDEGTRKAQQTSLVAAPGDLTDSRVNAGLRTSAVRGQQYGAHRNTTIPTASQAAEAVGVVPPLDVPGSTWKRAWNIFKCALPVLHLLDSCRPPDSKLSLVCLWWKALSANDRNSPVYDNLLAYDMLPSFTRVAVSRKLRRFYPRLHHANVEIRTAFLDQAVSRIVKTMDQNTKTRLISLGAGYDVRSIKLRERGVIDHAIELDLANVIDAKARIFHSARFRRRRPSLIGDKLPTLYKVDLNDVAQVQATLERILNADSCEHHHWHTIFLFEGVMIYLKDGVPAALLGVCRQVLKTTGQLGSLCFADCLENIPSGDADIGRLELASHGWNVTVWQPKPGIARHMGCAEMM
jgi:hypothetical protein